MALKRSLPPYAPTQSTLLEWATRMHEFITDVGVETAVIPQSILLRHQVDSELSRATEEGIMEWEPTLGHPVVSRDGEWEPLGYANVLFRATLANPLTITEAEGLVDVITLTEADIPAGLYVVTVSFVTHFQALNDQVTWQTIGDLVSPVFLKEAKDAAENIPFTYSVPAQLPEGPFTVTLQVGITGPGAADVIIETAHLFIVREEDD